MVLAAKAAGDFDADKRCDKRVWVLAPAASVHTRPFSLDGACVGTCFS